MLPVKRFYGRGFLLGLKDENPVFSYKETDEKFTVHKGEIIIAEGACTVSTDLIAHVSKLNCPIVFSGGARLAPASRIERMKTVKGQVEAYIKRREEVSLIFAKAAIINKAEALRAFSLLSGEGSFLVVADEVERVASRKGEPMALEGEATRKYFEAIARIIPEEYGFTGRTKRPPRDPVNAALSYGYSTLASTCKWAVWTAGLNPQVGFLHVPHRKRASLALDLEEEFRQPIVDVAVIPLFLTKSMRKKHFTYRAGGVYLNGKGRRMVMVALRERGRKTVDGVALKDAPLLQALRLAAYFRGEGVYQPFKWSWKAEMEG